MGYLLYKAAGSLVTPSTALTSLIVVGALLALAGRRAGGWLLLLASLVLVAAGFTTLSHSLLNSLENRFPTCPSPAGPVAGILLLGGYADAAVTVDRGELALSDAAERLLVFARLAKQFPDTKAVLVGGAADGPGESEVVARYLAEVGVDPGRVMIEGRSRTTAENALEAARMLKPGPGQRWLLVTSASHMPRAVGLFRAAGFDVVPVPTDFHTLRHTPLTFTLVRISDGLIFLDHAVKEWIGLLAARISGQSAELFPAPSPDAGLCRATPSAG